MKLLLLFFILFSVSANAVECDEWANFTKIITYRGRDKGVDIQVVKRNLEEGEMKGNPDMSTALNLVDYSYAHPELDSVQIWNAVYSNCKSKPTL